MSPAEQSSNISANDITHPSDKKSSSVHYFAIDSRQRDYDLYPQANNYYVPIPDNYNNVTSIELKAASLPRTEYNVNSSNKYIDFNIGDFISSIKIKNKNRNNLEVKHNGKRISQGTHYLHFDEPKLEGGKPPIITIDVDGTSTIEKNSFKVLYAGSGYTFSQKCKANLYDFEAFEVQVGFKYSAKLREGQYTIGGNPIMYDNVNNVYQQSWVPSKLLNEIESSMSNIILTDSEHCYSRKAWSTSNVTTDIDNSKDYPLLFNCRIMSQYPNIETYGNPNNRSSPEQFETNSCKFNRIYISNCLIFMFDSNLNNLPNEFTDENGISYEILKSQKINEEYENRYILYCKLKDSSNFNNWKGFSSCTNFNITFAHFELLFATGEYNIVNTSSLLGFNKRNYYKSTSIENILINDDKCLIPHCICYSSENDYLLFGDPEYIVLSFRPKHGANNLRSINDRVDSMDNSNINRVFACLLFEPVLPSVLQDLSSGTAMGTIDSFANSANNTKSFLVSNNNQNLNEDILLSGNVGNFNSADFRQPGFVKAMKGSDFDQKIIKFPQPMASLSHLNIRFTKFSKHNIGAEEELYNFQGKEHFLLFEIKCEDPMTGNHH